MALQDWYLVTALAVLLGLVCLLIFVILKMQKNQLEIQKVNQGFLREVLTNSTKSSENQTKLMDKLITILGVKDPIAFQQVQAMSSDSVPPTEPVVDNSDRGEMLSWIEENDQVLTPKEKELYRGITDF